MKHVDSESSSCEDEAVSVSDGKTDKCVSSSTSSSECVSITMSQRNRLEFLMGQTDTR